MPPFSDDAKLLAKLVSERDPDVSDNDATRAGLQTLLGALGDFYANGAAAGDGGCFEAINPDQPEVVSELARQSPAALPSRCVLSEADANLARNANIDLTLENSNRLANARLQTILV